MSLDCKDFLSTLCGHLKNIHNHNVILTKNTNNIVRLSSCWKTLLKDNARFYVLRLLILTRSNTWVYVDYMLELVLYNLSSQWYKSIKGHIQTLEWYFLSISAYICPYAWINVLKLVEPWRRDQHVTWFWGLYEHI